MNSNPSQSPTNGSKPQFVAGHTRDASHEEGRRPDLLDRKQAAAYIGMSVEWLSHNQEAGPPYIRFGNGRGRVVLVQREPDSRLNAFENRTPT